MAFVAQELPENEQNQFAQKGTTTPNPLASVPPSTGGSVGGAAPSVAPNVGTPTQFGSSASKLSDYLKTNAPQVEGQGQKIAGELTGQFNQTQGDINNAVQGFNSQVSQGYTAPNQDLVKAAAADPFSLSKDVNNIQNVQKQLDDTYAGPDNFESTDAYSSINKSVNNAVENAKAFDTPSGLSTYLKGRVKGNYTPGMNTLDTALLEGNPGAITSIRNSATPLKGLSDYLSNNTASLDKSVVDAQNAAQAAKKFANETFTGPGGVIPKFQGELNAGGPATDFLRNSQRSAGLNAFLGEGVPSDVAKYAGTPERQANIAEALSLPNTSKNQALMRDANAVLSQAYSFPKELPEQQAMIDAIIKSYLYQADR